MVRSSNCKTYGLPKKSCPCFKCSSRRINAAMRGGNLRRERKNTSRKEHDTKGRNNHGRNGGGKRW